MATSPCNKAALSPHRGRKALALRHHRDIAFLAACKKGILTLCGCTLLSLGLSACSSSSDTPYMTAEEIMASRTNNKSVLSGPEPADAAASTPADDKSAKSPSFGLEASWTQENVARYLEALQETDLVYDEETASFINMEAAPASSNVFERRSNILDPDATTVEYYDPEARAAGGDAAQKDDGDEDVDSDESAQPRPAS